MTLPTASISDRSTSTSSIVAPASWNADGSLIGGGDKAEKSTDFSILVSNPAAAQVTNGQAVTTQPDGGAVGVNKHVSNCGPSNTFPARADWVKFSLMFDNNKQSMRDNGATDEEIGRIYNSILKVAAAALVDRRVVSSDI